MSKPITRADVRAMFCQFVASLWTIQDVCAHLKCAESTFYRRRAAWKFPQPDIKEGSFIRWYPATVQNWKKPNGKTG